MIGNSLFVIHYYQVKLVTNGELAGKLGMISNHE